MFALELIDREEGSVGGFLVLLFFFALFLLILSRLGYLHLEEFLRALKRGLGDLIEWAV